MPVNKPPFSQGIFKRDAYFLSALLLADERLAMPQHKEIKEVAKFHSRGEINRLLMLLATSARIMMDNIKAKTKKTSYTSNVICGEYRKELPDMDEEEESPLIFYTACNTILHAVRINDCVTDAYGKITITIDGTRQLVGQDNVVNTHADLNAMEFVRCCIMVVEEV